MTNLTIPAILVAIVMVAGAFALMPVEEASTVHTTLQAAQGSLFSVTVTDTLGAGAAIRDFTLDCTTDCIITGILAQNTASGATADVCHIANLEIDDIEVIVDIAVPANDLTGIDLPDGTVTNLDEQLAQLFTGSTVHTAIDITTSLTASAPIDVISAIGAETFQSGIVPNPAGVKDVVVEINCSTNGASNTIAVTFSGFMVGTTEPTGDVVADA